MTTFGKNHHDTYSVYSAPTAIRMDPIAYACFAIIVMHSVAVISSSSTDRQLFFGLMLSDQNGGALPGIEAAVDEINSRNDLLPGYRLNYDLINSQAVSYLRLL